MALKAQSSDRLRLGMVKIVVDGSIQGFSARLRWPGYYNGAEQGLWYVAPPHLAEALELALAQGVHVHCHTNGDEATELVLDTMEAALRKHPSPDHRFTLQHCQLADSAQFRRMKQTGLCVNLFPNHHFHWGDEHYRLTVGPERAERMNACRTALDIGVPLAIHSDAPVTPACGALFAAWCAVQPARPRAARTLGAARKEFPSQRALRTITLGAAWTLKLDAEVGSIETGKRADFAILEDDPTEVGAENLGDVRIWGFGGAVACSGSEALTFRANALPVTVIGGYLGAGKTTLVNHLLRHARGRRIAVAVNEFGALPIDQDLILGADGDVLTLAGGCVCCSFGDDLATGLRPARTARCRPCADRGERRRPARRDRAIAGADRRLCARGDAGRRRCRDASGAGGG